MGALLSTVASAVQPPAPPPAVVLVPPMFERDVLDQSRFCHSSYEYLGHRQALKRLLADHLATGLGGRLLLSPPADPRVSVAAYLKPPGGSMVLRWQPGGAAAVQRFAEVAASLENPGDVALRAAWLHEPSGLGAFVTAPLAKRLSGGAAEVGLRYSSPRLAAGAVVTPRDGRLAKLWLAGRHEGLTLGLEVHPQAALPLRGLVLQPPPPPPPAADIAKSWAGGLPPPPPPPMPTPSLGGDSGGGAKRSVVPADAGPQSLHATGTQPLFSDPARLAAAGEWLRARSSLLLAYSPPVTPGTGPSFTAAVEVVDGRRLAFSFFQHIAATRQVVNPFEEDEVVGITNYVDIGLQLTTAIGPGGPPAAPSTDAAAATAPAPAAGPAALAAKAAGAGPAGGGGEEAPAVNFAVSWQLNKNWLVKGRVGSDSAAAAVGVRVWHAVSAYLTACVRYDYASKATRYGAELCVENFGPLRYERGADDVAAGRALLQRHEASDQDLANFAGKGVLIRRATGPGAAAARARGAAGAEAVEAERRRVAALM